MKLLGWTGFVILSLTVASLVYASGRHTRYYRLSDKGMEFVEASPYVLSMTSADLERYPRAVVTFDVRTENSRTPSSIAPPESVIERLRARRHYVRLSDNEFGRAGESEIVFNPKAHTVFIAFLGKTGRTFFYKEVSEGLAIPAPRQTQQLGRLDPE